MNNTNYSMQTEEKHCDADRRRTASEAVLGLPRTWRDRGAERTAVCMDKASEAEESRSRRDRRGKSIPKAIKDKRVSRLLPPEIRKSLPLTSPQPGEDWRTFAEWKEQHCFCRMKWVQMELGSEQKSDGKLSFRRWWLQIQMMRVDPLETNWSRFSRSSNTKTHQ